MLRSEPSVNPKTPGCRDPPLYLGVHLKGSIRSLTVSQGLGLCGLGFWGYIIHSRAPLEGCCKGGYYKGNHKGEYPKPKIG